MEALQVEAKDMTAKYTEARKRCDQLERDLKLALQETQAQSTALNRLTSHVLQARSSLRLCVKNRANVC